MKSSYQSIIESTSRATVTPEPHNPDSLSDVEQPNGVYDFAKSGDFNEMWALLARGFDHQQAANGLAEAGFFPELVVLMNKHREELRPADIACSLIKGGHVNVLDNFIAACPKDFDGATADSRFNLRQVGIKLSASGHEQAYRSFLERYDGIFDIPSLKLREDSVFRRRIGVPEILEEYRSSSVLSEYDEGSYKGIFDVLSELPSAQDDNDMETDGCYAGTPSP